ncbi:Acyl-[acyl-carrier-protein]--UDP-N-acetylglucosamine O-acyltransferase [Dirofilaria immitis]
MKLIFISWESGCEEVYTKGWKILADSIALTPTDIVIYHGDILHLEDDTVYIYASSGAKKPYLIETSFSSSRFISFHAAYEKLLISEEGRLFGCGRTAHGEFNMISANPVESLREIGPVTPLAICSHGCLVTTAESLKLSAGRKHFVCLTVPSADEKMILMLKIYQLWEFGRRINVTNAEKNMS